MKNGASDSGRSRPSHPAPPGGHRESGRRSARLNRAITRCELCPRLREHCQQIAIKKRRAYLDWDYWGRPVPNFGPLPCGLLIVGLAPGAHGANRTGRMFTGDRSGDWLFRAMDRAGFATQPESEHKDDGLQLVNCCITAICHCAPPDNKPTREELDFCRPWLETTVELADPRVFLALGQLAWNETARMARQYQWLEGRRPRFAHGAECELSGGRVLLGSYHPSQQNTFTGRLTEAMLDAVMHRAKRLIENKTSVTSREKETP